LSSHMYYHLNGHTIGMWTWNSKQYMDFQAIFQKCICHLHVQIMPWYFLITFSSNNFTFWNILSPTWNCYLSLHSNFTVIYFP
jgi:hypothetical protein